MPNDIILILGGGINEDGSLRGPSQRRVELAAQLYKKGAAPYIIASSKWGCNIDFVPSCTIAAAMKKYLVEQGIPEQNIFVEEKSQDTIGNVYFTKTLFLEPKQWRSIVVVTSKFQQARAEYLCRKIFGPDYDLHFEIAPNGLNLMQLAIQKGIEKTLLIKTKKALDVVVDGNHEVLKDWVETGKHLKLASSTTRSPFHERNMSYRN